MRKVLLALALAAFVPLASFAAGSDFQLGVSAMYPYSLQSDEAVDGSPASYISPGLEARLRFLHILQIGGSATLLEPFAAEAKGVKILSSLDGGLCLDLFLVRVGAGIGPTLIIDSYKGETESMSEWNFRLYAELQLGRVSLGVAGQYFFEEVADVFKYIGERIDDPYLSATLLFKL